MANFNTSPLGGRLLFDGANLNADDPIDTVLMRDAVVNNALHWADSAGQVLVSWAATEGSSSPQAYQIADPLNDSEWGPVGPLGPVSLRVGRSARPYRWRFRLAGASGAGDAVDFALVWGRSADELQGKVDSGTGDQVRWTGITSTTPAWLTPDGSGDPYVDLDVGAVALALESTLLDLSDDASRVGVWEVFVALYGRTANKTSDPRVWAIHVSEYVGE